MSHTNDPAVQRIEFDGTVIYAKPGQSVAAALMDAGIRSWRSTRVNDKPRGLFCGIGICYDCLLTINGQPNQRACLAPADEGTICETNWTEKEPGDA
ncbi:(2Fe-2S)-binding protein [Rothia sp. AR01]|uniref:(2Fe-2S)-binding protein n=1 Tax=Rothia santali TaxID=2949643 RepID=A0A9X2KHS0_9MICC|nr:(2Fe-2S)-binding protein [Rothia santali]MCP3425215.1 (2Fe-2S)-binding protein [Rothia santali]